MDRLEHSGERRFSICLQGPPGTGKSAYTRYPADRLGLEVMHRRASDLKSMWVGGTEQNIARAFAEARDTEAFLIFNEADSLLADWRGAHRSWEVAQVNEMVTWMESHPLPFVCSDRTAICRRRRKRRCIFNNRKGRLRLHGPKKTTSDKPEVIHRGRTMFRRRLRLCVFVATRSCAAAPPLRAPRARLCFCAHVR